MSDDDHPDFDNEGMWPRRLLHVPTMTSHKWQPGNKYNGQSEPHYNAISYTWGRWRLSDDDNPIKNPEVDRLGIKGVPWRVPRIDPTHFTVRQFEEAIRRAVQRPPLDAPLGIRKAPRLVRRIMHPPEFLWLDIACIDQRGTATGKAEVGRQARIFRSAKSVYVWLNHTSHSDMELVDQYLTENAAIPDYYGGGAGLVEAFSEEQERRVQSREIHQVISRFTADPWFSSLWTLQEAFLCPTAVFLAQDAQCVKRDESFTFTLASFVGNLGTICSKTRNALQIRSSGDTSNLEQQQNHQNLEDLIDLIESTGAEGLESGNPMAVLTLARFRTASHHVDYVYGIMQIFGDGCRVGETAASRPRPPHPGPNAYTLSDLQDELGLLLLDHYPILSQLHSHLDPPPIGKGWRVCARSAEASTVIGFHNAIARRPGIGDPYFRPDDALAAEFPYEAGTMVARCKLTTTTVSESAVAGGSSTWGHFTGRACRYDILQQAWSRNHRALYDPFTNTTRPELAHLGIALDSLPILQGRVLSLYARGAYMRGSPSPKFPNEIAHEISERFAGRTAVVVLLGERRYASDNEGYGGIADYVDNQSCDSFLGLILLSRIREEDGSQYWQRIGVCHWESHLVKPAAAAADSDESDVLLAQGPSWVDLQGVFG
ncbi:hypothetical protein BJY01DRAFT_251527 [Aspergillus pseudoustus]|uniref:Heterokaryon incompatibility domain-containing protein n=1 Tax=Aspergillus pseudoustus TaxID=1810923 RepID=A0ABR4JBG0_9EURO